MSTAEIKLKIIRLIDQVEDAEQLFVAYQKLVSILGFESKPIPETRDALEESLRISMKQVEEGKVIPHEEVISKYRKTYPKD